MKGSEVRALLARTDKWFLSGGKRLLWAPPFPACADYPGFWDPATFLDVPVEAPFALTLLDEEHRELTATMVHRSWTPSDLTQRYALGVENGADPERAAGLEVEEQKALLPSDVLVSVYTVENRSERDRELHLVQWTCQATDAPRASRSFIGELRATRDWTGFSRQTNDEHGEVSQRYGVALGADRPCDSFTVKLSDGPNLGPRWWKTTPFPELLALGGGRLPGETDLRGPRRWPRGFGYMARVYRLAVPAGGRVTVRLYAAVGAELDEAVAALRAIQGEPDPIGVSRAAWDAYFESLPAFCCSDPYLERYYWYRFYGLRANAVEGGPLFNLPHPAVFEGINPGWFRHAITYSAQVLMLEARWLHDPALAQGNLLNFIHNQREDGSFPGAVLHERNGKKHQGFYHAGWGKAVRALHAVHPDREFLARAYASLERYLAYFDRKRDREGMGLYDVVDHWETGQEFMSRYTWIDPDGDNGEPLNPRLKGVDATVYIYETQQTMAWMARELGRPEAEVARWEQAAERTRRAVLTAMWDPGLRMFCDVNPVTGHRSPVKAAVCFYPFRTDLVGTEHLGAIYDHLLNPAEFWTPYPVPSTSVDDATYSPVGEWEGRRLVCPWNGRNWLMSTSHVAEALARMAQTLDERLKPHAAELLRRFVRMVFLDGDPLRPSSYEYYNPVTGQAPYFRGTEEYMHSYIADLILQYAGGVQPGDDGALVVDPLPMGLSWFTVERARIAGRWVTVHWREQDLGDGVAPGLTVLIDGQVAAHRERLERLTLRLTPGASRPSAGPN